MYVYEPSVNVHVLPLKRMHKPWTVIFGTSSPSIRKCSTISLWQCKIYVVPSCSMYVYIYIHYSELERVTKICSANLSEHSKFRSAIDLPLI